MSGRYGAAVTYGVFQVGQDWKLCCGRYELRRFPEQAGALTAARTAADLAVGAGFTPEIYLHQDAELVRIAD